MTEIRPITADDRPEVCRLMRALFPDAGDDLEAEVDAYMSGRVGLAIILVAERSSGGLAGFIEVGTRNYAEGCGSSPVPFIEAWYVDADLRLQGVGRRLFAAAEDWARAQDFREIASDAETSNEGSIAAHRALGYEEVERIVCFRKSLLFLLVLLLVAACTSFTDIPETEATVHGQITQIDAAGRVLIEADIQKCERFWFSIGPDTRVLQQTGTGDIEKGTVGDLQVGRTARAWANGPIAESCPAQTSAGVILLF